MRYLTFVDPEPSTFEVCILAPSLHLVDMRRIYIDPHFSDEAGKVLAYDLFKNPTGKPTKVALQKEYLDDLLPVLEDLGVRYLLCADGEYFKTLTKKPTAEPWLGYVLPSTCGRFQVAYCPNYRTLYRNPGPVTRSIAMAVQALKDHRAGAYDDPGEGVIRFEAYPSTVEEIRLWLDRLVAEDRPLTADIEGFGLRHDRAGIGSIGFAWSKHEGIAFPVDFLHEAVEIRALLKDFFLRFPNRIRWHNISFDACVLVYQLFMENLLDTAGLLDGLEVMLKDWDCTQIITYLATNSCAGNKLGLKDQSQEFAGKYAVDVTDIRTVPLDDLLRYNLIDCLSTWHVYEKHWPTVVRDNQVQVYETLFKPAVKDIIQMQLTGLPLDMARVREVKAALQEIWQDAEDRMRANRWVGHVEQLLALDWAEKRNAELKKKRVTPADWKERFNPNSGPQLQRLLYEGGMDLPVLDTTDTGQPATGGDTLEKLLNHTSDPDALAFLEALIDYMAVDKLLTSFIPAFLDAAEGPDGWHYLFGSFKLGGTVSGRLSSSKPNLQNLPANVTMKPRPELLERLEPVLGTYVSKGKLSLGKLVKSCFRAPPGWLFCGLDFASLEDRISALTTRDPQKLAVYLDGFDGHSLRAQAYFGDEMPDIDPTSVESINSIADRYPAQRQASKTPTFLLTYGGSWRGIVNQMGWPEAKAKMVEARYHELYKVSDEWVAARIQEATQRGYVEIAFGLRLRTPLLHQVVLGNSRTPPEAEAEGRTAGNALGQSWGLLNTRAGIEFMDKVRESEHRHDIRPCSHIHDAQYVLIRDEMAPLLFTNEHLVRAVEWQDDPLIAHPEVKLGGELSIFHPSWAEELSLPNGASSEKIKSLAFEHHLKYCGDLTP